MSNTTLSGPFLSIVDGFSSYEIKATIPEARPVQGQSIRLGQQATYFHEESCASDFAAASASRLATFASVLDSKLQVVWLPDSSSYSCVEEQLSYPVALS